MKTTVLFFLALLAVSFSFPPSIAQAAPEKEQFRNEIVKERVKSTLKYPNGETIVERDEEFETTRSVPVVVEVKYVRVAGFYRRTKEPGEAKRDWEKYMNCPYATFLADNGLTVRQAENLPAGRKLFFREKYLKEGYEKVLEKNEGLTVELAEVKEEIVEVRKELSITKMFLAEAEKKLNQVASGMIQENGAICSAIYQEAKEKIVHFANWIRSCIYGTSTSSKYS